MTKYNNTRVEYDGHRFDSQREAWEYLHLRALEQQGAITGLQVHPTYTLVEPFTHSGKRVRGVTYTPDFEYVRADGKRVIVDVKGGKATQTETWRLKWKLLMRLLPAAAFEVVE